MTKKNEAIFDKIEARFDALNAGVDANTEDRNEEAAKAEYGEFVSENQKQQVAMDEFDEEGQLLRDAADNLFSAVKRSADYSGNDIEGVKSQTDKYEKHLRIEHGDDVVNKWLDESK